MATAVGAAIGSITLLVTAHVALTGVLVIVLLAAGLRLGRTAERLDRLEERQRDDSARTRKALGRGPGSISAKIRHDVIRDVDSLLSLHLLGGPVASGTPLTNYSALPQTCALLRDEVSQLSDGALVVELGGGATTVWMALAVRASGKQVRIVSLDSSSEWVEVTRAALRRNGVENLVDLRYAQLAPGSDGVTSWYSPEAWGDLRDIDLLVVDGPPGASAPTARLPVVDALGARMALQGRVVLDDVDRAPEQAMLDAWLALRFDDDRGAGWRVVDRRERVVLLSRDD